MLLYYVIDKLHHLKGLPGFISACIFAGSLRYDSNYLLLCNFAVKLAHILYSIQVCRAKKKLKPFVIYHTHVAFDIADPSSM